MARDDSTGTDTTLEIQMQKNSVAVGGADLTAIIQQINIAEMAAEDVGHPGVIVKLLTSLVTTDVISLQAKHASDPTSDTAVFSRSLHLIPVASADVTVKQETVSKNFDTSSAWSLITGNTSPNDLTIAPGSGTYMVFLRVDTRTPSVNQDFTDISLHNGGTIITHTIRRIRKEADNASSQYTSFIAAKVTVSGGDAIEGRVRTSTGSNSDLVQRSLIVIAVASGDVVEKSATDSQTISSDTYAVLDTMTEAIDGSGDPGAGDYDCFFSANVPGCRSASDQRVLFGMHLDAVLESNVINSHFLEGSMNTPPYAVGVAQSHFLAIADTEVLDIRWRTTDTALDAEAVERTLVLWKRVAGVAPPIPPLILRPIENPLRRL